MTIFPLIVTFLLQGGIPACPSGMETCEPADRAWSRERPLPNTPHTLVISDGTAMTRMEYRTGPQCQRARQSTLMQTLPGYDARVVIAGSPRIQAFCVPR